MEQNKKTKARDLILLSSVALASITVLSVLMILFDDRSIGHTFSLPGAIKTILISMVPVVELRGAIPIAFGAYELPLLLAFLFSYIGNCIIIPPVILLTRTVLDWLKTHVSFLKKLLERFESMILRKGEKALKYAEIGLLLFVAVPLPGTGAWTGAMIAGLLNLRLRTATPIIAVGVLVAGTIMTLLTLVFDVAFF